MPFEKGKSGNEAGRPPGSRNKAGEGLRILIADFLEQRFDQVQQDFEKLEPKDRIKTYIDLLHYTVPKLQAVSNSIDFDRMTDEQLQEIIDQLIAAHANQ